MADARGASVKVAIAGVGGYAGGELVRLLLQHAGVGAANLTLLGRDSGTTSLFPVHAQLSGTPGYDTLRVRDFAYTGEAFAELVAGGTHFLLLATPHETSRAWAPLAVAAGLRVVDLSGAWRLHEPSNAAVYKLHDTDATAAAALQHEAVYGSPELNAAAIANARLVANPGCYATSVILALAPLVRAQLLDLDHGIVADAKSGVSGAGKAPTATTHFMHAADNLSAYAVFDHRHTGEWLEQLGLAREQIDFTPHLLPIPRGILSTLYVRFREPQSQAAVQRHFDSFYAAAPCVTVLPSPLLPDIASVVRTPFCRIGFQLSPDGTRAVLISCLDNLLKGAASQAIENLNLMAGFGQSEGLL